MLVLTVAQLAVAEYVPGIDRFADKAFGARLIAYPVMMLFVPAVWWLVQRRQGRSDRPPYLAFGLIGVPFLIDVTGNSLDLYDSVVWWDDFNHFVNWVFLCLGLALVIVPRLRPAWVLVTLVTGFGCILALGWELGEWYTFIRHGTELDTAYEDTLRRHDPGHPRLAGRRVAGAPARAPHLVVIPEALARLSAETSVRYAPHVSLAFTTDEPPERRRRPRPRGRGDVRR